MPRSALRSQRHGKEHHVEMPGAGVEQHHRRWGVVTPDHAQELVAHLGVRREYSTMPEPASSTENPPGALMMASSSRALPVNTSCSVILGCRLSTTSRLARPRSASIPKTRWPLRVNAAARLAETKVFPTPPLPLVMAMMRSRDGGLHGRCVRRHGLGDSASLIIPTFSRRCLLHPAGRQVAPARRRIQRAKQQALFFSTHRAVGLLLDAHAVAS